MQSFESSRPSHGAVLRKWCEDDDHECQSGLNLLPERLAWHPEQAAKIPPREVHRRGSALWRCRALPTRLRLRYSQAKRLVEAGGFPTLIKFTRGQPDKPLIVF